MKSLQFALLLLILIFAAGCASFKDKPKTIILQNPKTMEFVYCRVDEWGTEKSYNTNEQCAEDYQKQGFRIWGER